MGIIGYTGPVLLEGRRIRVVSRLLLTPLILALGTWLSMTALSRAAFDYERSQSRQAAESAVERLKEGMTRAEVKEALIDAWNRDDNCLTRSESLFSSVATT